MLQGMKNLKVWAEFKVRGCLQEGETNFRLVYMQKFRSGWLLEIK